ncbi:hypothetical protein BOX15_Mlig009776g4, partial [Macrostomum lignano]
IHRVRGGVMDMIDVVNNRKCKVRCRIAIPQDNFPGFNFVGKLLGSGGSTLKKLQEDCNVKMAILGRGSMRDPQKEQEAFESGDPKYQHLKQALHLQIDCVDAPEEAYYRISRAVYEAKNIMIPDPSELAAAAAASGYGAPGPFPPGRGGFPGGGGGPRGGRGGRGRGGRAAELLTFRPTLTATAAAAVALMERPAATEAVAVAAVAGIAATSEAALAAAALEAVVAASAAAVATMGTALVRIMFPAFIRAIGATDF